MRFHSIAILLVYFQLCVYAQDKQQKTCFKTIQELQERFKISFNYESDVIDSLTCPKIDSVKSLNENLELINNYSGLRFVSVGNNIQAIFKDYKHALKIINQVNEPIPNVTIDSTAFKSNSYGMIFLPRSFSLPKIKLEHPSYRFDSVQLNDHGYTIVTNAKIIILNEIQIASLFATGIYLSGSNNIILKPHEVGQIAGLTQQDVIKSIQNLPGVFSLNESASNLSIKGGTNDQNLILWNGIRLYQNSHFFGLISSFNENLIDEIDIYDNATPAKLGNSVSGTIKMNHHLNKVNEFEAGIGANFLSIDAFVKQPINKRMRFSLTARKSLTDFWNSPTYRTYSNKAFRDTNLSLLENNLITEEELRRDDSFRFQDAEAHFNWSLNNKIELNINGIYFENDLEYSEENLTIADTRTSDVSQTNFALGGNIKYQLSNKQSFILETAYSNYESAGINNTFSSEQESIQENEIDDYRTNVHWNYLINENKQLQVGFNYNRIEILNTFQNNITNASLFRLEFDDVYAPYVQYDFVFNKLMIDLGFRIPFYGKSNQIELEPRLNVDYELTEKLHLNFRGERKSQNITQLIDLDNNFLGIERRRWFLSNNTDYPIQVSEQLELGVNYQNRFLSVIFSTYYKLTEGISTDSQGFRNQDQFDNLIGSSGIFGILMHSSLKWNNFNLWVSYSYLNEEYKFTGSIPSYFRGNNDISNRVVFGSSYKFNKFIASLGFEYHTGIPFTNINAEVPIISGPLINTINYESPNSSSLRDYFRADASIQYLYKAKNGTKFKFVFGFTNLTNRTNILRRNVRLNQVTGNEVVVIEEQGLEFTPNIGFQIFFK